MVVVRPTKKALSALGIALEETSPQTTSGKLGDWYLNLVTTLAGDLFVFVNAATLLAVAIPAEESNVLQLFTLRVANLLTMLGFSKKAIEAELRHFREIALAKPVSRRVQGSANEIAWRLQRIAEDSQAGKPLSLSSAEFHLSRIPHAPLGFRMPREVAWELL